MATKPEFPAFVYKILDSEPPSPIPHQLPLSALDAQDGFIHLSNAQQVPITADLYFASYTRLWLLKISSEKAEEGSAHLVWEGPAGCVHLYGGRLGEGVVVGVKEYSKIDGNKWADVFAQESGAKWLVDQD